MKMEVDQRLLAQDFILNSTKRNFINYPYSTEMFTLAQNFTPEQQALVQKLKAKEIVVEDYNLGRCSPLDVLYFLEKADFNHTDHFQKLDQLKKYGFPILIEQIQEYETFLNQIICTSEFMSFIAEKKAIVTKFNRTFENKKNCIHKRLKEITGENLADDSTVYYTTSNGFNLRSSHANVIYSYDNLLTLVHEMMHQQFDERIESSISKANIATNFDEKTYYLEKQHPFIRLMAQELTNCTKEYPKPVPYSECNHTKKDCSCYPIWYIYIHRNDPYFLQKIMEGFEREHLTSEFVGKNLTPTIIQKMDSDMPYWELWTALIEIEKNNLHKEICQKDTPDFKTHE